MSINNEIYMHLWIYSINKGNFFKQRKIIFFQIFFFRKCKFFVWNWFITKINLISQKIFLLRLFKIVANQTGCSRFEQRSFIKFLVAEKCKPCKIYRTMGDVYGEANFCQKVYKYLQSKHGLANMTLNQKDSPWSRNI